MQKSIPNKALSLLLALLLFLGIFVAAAVGLAATVSLASPTAYAATGGTTHTVTFDTDGGSQVPSQTVNDGEQIIHPSEPTKTGYTFVTWCFDAAKTSVRWKPVTSDITLYAVWVENSLLPNGFNKRVLGIDTDTTYANIEGGYAAYALVDISNVELNLGDGFSIFTSMKKGKVAYGMANFQPVTIAGHPQVTDVITFDLHNITATGKMSFDYLYYDAINDVYSRAYVYGPTADPQNYLGTTGNKIPYMSTYYISTSAPPSSSSSNSSSNSSKSKSSSSNNNSNTTLRTSPPAPVNAANAVQNVKDAVTAAKSSPNGATVTLKNVTTISLATMREMAKAAGNTPLKVSADSFTPTGAIDVRITIDLSKAEKNLNLSASTTSAEAKSIGNKFQKYFNNNISVVSLSQKSDFGMPVRIAAKIDPKLNTSTLVLYSYDSKTNIYTLIETPQYTVNKGGYVHFNTTLGGEIIIADKPLVKK